MDQVHTFVELDQFPSAQGNAIQDAAAPQAPFVGYKRGGDLQTKVAAGKIVYVSPIVLCMSANCVDTAANITETSLDTTSLGLAADTWYYLYGSISAGVISYTASTGIPDEALIFKDGDTSKRYLGSFRTNGSSNILPFYKVGPKYTYRRSQVASTVFRIGGGTFSVQVWGFIETWDGTAALAPPHIRMIEVLMHGRTSVGNLSAAIASYGDGGVGYEAGRLFCARNVPDEIQNQLVVELECNTAQRIDLYNDIGELDLYFVGFSERSV